MKSTFNLKIIFLAIVLFVSMIACSSYEVSSGYVYICKGTNSYAYHYNPHCRGLKRCTTSLEKITEKEARAKGRKLCGYED
ncbi:hypothetical protein [uncultured Capnocytophaga sp.]|jgi:hypothetical protein|uniref:hypothetical protein n=1 Tax=uncultured Capnocytophaga sp. TaxID=159273 RepID=UPI0025918D5D|nr:hypothetical protein [uncultured Capnocytophaga sp.]